MQRYEASIGIAVRSDGKRVYRYIADFDADFVDSHSDISALHNACVAMKSSNSTSSLSGTLKTMEIMVERIDHV